MANTNHMERRGFFAKMFRRGAPETPTEPSVEAPPTPKQEDETAELERKFKSRRRFLKGLGAAGTVATAGGIGRVAFRMQDAAASQERSEAIRNETKEQLKEFVTVLEDFRERNAPKTKSGRVMKYTSRSLEQQDAFHAKFTKEMGNAATEKMVQALFTNDTEAVRGMYSALKNMDGLGVFYAALDAASVRPGQSGALKSDNVWRRDRMRVRAADYLPEGKKIPDLDVDPRLGQLHGIADNTGDTYAKGSAARSIRSNKSWASEERYALFTKTMDDPEIRQMLQASDMTLAEAYSAIKAGLRAEGFTGDQKKVREKVAETLAAREQFKTKEILGKNTDKFLYFNHPAKSEDRSVSDESTVALAEYMQQLHGNNDVAVELQNENGLYSVDGSSAILDGASYEEALAVTSGARILKALKETRGNVTVMFNTHGEEDKIAISEKAKDHVWLSSGDIAKSLIDRVEDEENPQALAGMNIIIATCYGHDFGKKLGAKLASEFERRLGKPAAELAMPTVITPAQEGSVSYEDGMTKEIADNKMVFKKAGALTGEFLLRRVQPRSYHYGDLTVFSGENAADWKEVAATEDASDARMAA